MTTSDTPDRARSAALNRIDRAERSYRLAFFAAIAFEAVFLASYLLLANLRDRVQLLILIAAIGIYGILGMGLFTLGAYINRSSLRVISAIEASRENERA
jgi:hypothetical protein